MTSRPSFVKYAIEVFRAYITDGVPGSGAQKPVKADIRTWGAKIETSLDDLYDKAITTLGGIGGTADAITATGTPTVDALLAGQAYWFTPTGTNTVIGPTLNIDSLTAKTIADAFGSPLPKAKLVANRAHLLVYDGTVLRLIGHGFAKGYLFGLILANNGGTPLTKIDIGAGQCRSDDDAFDFVFTATFTKDLGSTWVVGSGNGGLDTGALAASTSYDVYAIGRTDGTAQDFIACKTLLGFTFPTGYSKKRLIGQFMTSGASQIIAATWYADGTAFLSVPVSDVAVTNPGTAAVLRTLTAPLSSIAIFTAWLNNVTTAAVQLLITDPSQADTTPSTTLFDLRGTATGQTNSAEFRRRLSSGQVRIRQQASGASDALNVITRGWWTDRGIH